MIYQSVSLIIEISGARSQVVTIHPTIGAMRGLMMSPVREMTPNVDMMTGRVPMLAPRVRSILSRNGRITPEHRDRRDRLKSQTRRIPKVAQKESQKLTSYRIEYGSSAVRQRIANVKSERELARLPEVMMRYPSIPMILARMTGISQPTMLL